MSRRTKIIILVIIVLVVVAMVWILLVSRRRTTSPPPPTPAAAGPAIPSLPTPPAAPLSTAGAGAGGTAPLTGPAAEVGVEVLARSFVERYGSYSNQSNFENLENLYAFMTGRLRRESEAFVSKQRAVRTGVPAVYAGTTTRVLSVKTLAKSAGEATLRAMTQRTETQAGNPPRVYYQDIELTMKNVGEEWRVDTATWK